MTSYDPAGYGKAVGDDYDALYPGVPSETAATVDALAALAEARPGNSVLELGIGTGRVALALHTRGLRVAGVDGSESMVEQLRRKPGADTIDVVIGDYRDAGPEERFAVVALLFNGILDPRGRQAQLDIFRNAARRLEPGGVFVVEALVLSDAQRSGEWCVNPRFVRDGHVELQLLRYDIDTNVIERTLVHLREDARSEFVTVRDVYSAPGELDVMAEVTGFRLLRRSAGWRGEQFSSTSARHVSVYALEDPAGG